MAKKTKPLDPSLADLRAHLGAPWQSLVLDHASSEAYYKQLQRQIQSWIAQGLMGAGKNLPSERDLAAALGLSRTTIKRCYSELRSSDQLSAHGRHGTVVQAPVRVTPTLGKLRGFTQEMRELGKTASTVIVSKTIVHDRMMASLFNRSSTAQFLRLVRIRKGDDMPMTREVAWYDLSLVPALAQWDAQGSAYEFIQTHSDIRLSWADQTVEAILSSTEENQAFGFAEPMPCLLFKRKTHSAQDVLVEYVEGTFRGDAYVYKLKLETGGL